MPDEPSVAYEGKGFFERLIILTTGLSTVANVIIEINRKLISYTGDC